MEESQAARQIEGEIVWLEWWLWGSLRLVFGVLVPVLGLAFEVGLELVLVLPTGKTRETEWSLECCWLGYS